MWRSSEKELPLSLFSDLLFLTRRVTIKTQPFEILLCVSHSFKGFKHINKFNSHNNWQQMALLHPHFTDEKLEAEICLSLAPEVRAASNG